MVNSREKGKRAEISLAKELTKYGYECRRGQQYNGLEGEDVVGLPHIHIECKAVERLNLRDAYQQSKDDAKDDQIPVVIHKKNRQPWLVTLNLNDFMMMYRCWEREWNE